MKTLRTHWQTSLLAVVLALLQACTRELPRPTAGAPAATPAPTLARAAAADGDAGTVLLRRLHRPAGADTTGQRKGHPAARARDTCTEIVDVYYNLYTGEVVAEVLVETRCPGQGDSPGGGVGVGAAAAGAAPGPAPAPARGKR